MRASGSPPFRPLPAPAAAAPTSIAPRLNSASPSGAASAPSSPPCDCSSCAARTLAFFFASRRLRRSRRSLRYNADEAARGPCQRMSQHGTAKQHCLLRLAALAALTTQPARSVRQMRSAWYRKAALPRLAARKLFERGWSHVGPVSISDGMSHANMHAWCPHAPTVT
jgi:hypothetical protein